ncbi:MAG TPA: hypothetical protein VEX62_07670 [Candidatus Limnocylindrales bacterium]|nr:hypothetical protein [Candidatus Limnocylindrales bacterium]
MPVPKQRWIILAVIAFAVIAFGAEVLRSYFYLPMLGGGSGVIHSEDSLPARLKTCGRDWNRSNGRQYVTAEINRSDMPPAVVDPGMFPACPAGACTRTAGGPCHTVIFVRVAEDAYVAYALSGGP